MCSIAGVVRIPSQCNRQLLARMLNVSSLNSPVLVLTSRQNEEKRVSNAKVKDELGVELVFPSFREGLQAIHQGNAAPFQ